MSAIRYVLVEKEEKVSFQVEKSALSIAKHECIVTNSLGQ